jgi:hypothetical protein
LRELKLKFTQQEQWLLWCKLQLWIPQPSVLYIGGFHTWIKTTSYPRGNSEPNKRDRPQAIETVVLVKQPCRKWNGNTSCFFSHRRFHHVCSTCGWDHPATHCHSHLLHGWNEAQESIGSLDPPVSTGGWCGRGCCLLDSECHWDMSSSALSKHHCNTE